MQILGGWETVRERESRERHADRDGKGRAGWLQNDGQHNQRLTSHKVVSTVRCPCASARPFLAYLCPNIVSGWVLSFHTCNCLVGSSWVDTVWSGKMTRKWNGEWQAATVCITSAGLFGAICFRIIVELDNEGIQVCMAETLRVHNWLHVFQYYFVCFPHLLSPYWKIDEEKKLKFTWLSESYSFKEHPLKCSVHFGSGL